MTTTVADGRFPVREGDHRGSVREGLCGLCHVYWNRNSYDVVFLSQQLCPVIIPLVVTCKDHIKRNFYVYWCMKRQKSIAYQIFIYTYIKCISMNFLKNESLRNGNMIPIPISELSSRRLSPISPWRKKFFTRIFIN
jgi:hypothetical protein